MELTIENERLRTTVFILNQKIKIIEDGTRECDEKLQAKINQLVEVNRMFEKELEDLTEQLHDQKEKNNELEGQLKDWREKAEEAIGQEKKLTAITAKLHFDIEELSNQV